MREGGATMARWGCRVKFAIGDQLASTEASEYDSPIR